LLTTRVKWSGSSLSNVFVVVHGEEFSALSGFLWWLIGFNLQRASHHTFLSLLGTTRQTPPEFSMNFLGLVFCRQISQSAIKVSRRFISHAEKEREMRLRGDPRWRKWTGTEEWKNWIDFDSPHQEQTDNLNRLRHFFWHVNEKGELFRKELGDERLLGQMKDDRIVDYFFEHMEHNTTGLYVPEYPFLSRRLHELYFVSCRIAPIVFFDLREGQLRFGANLRTKFDPTALQVSQGEEVLNLFNICVYCKY
jgi:hypothetical protein